jgi:hypothetical protein
MWVSRDWISSSLLNTVAVGSRKVVKILYVCYYDFDKSGSLA